MYGSSWSAMSAELYFGFSVSWTDRNSQYGPRGASQAQAGSGPQPAVQPATVHASHATTPAIWLNFRSTLVLLMLLLALVSSC
jgi:hypothetical protein